MTETDALPPEPVTPDEEPRFIRSLRLTNLLSFGPKGEAIELRSLNVLVGANGSGKTNFVEGLAVLAATPNDFTEPIRAGGGIASWINNASRIRSATIQGEFLWKGETEVLAHRLVFAEHALRPRLAKEVVVKYIPNVTISEGLEVFGYDGAEAYYIRERQPRESLSEWADGRMSILAQLRGPKRYPEIDHLQRLYGLIRLYRNWSFGPDSPLRKPQASDLPNDSLAEDYGNLFLILNRMEFEPEAKEGFLERLRDFLPDVTNYKLQIVGGTILMFLMEGRNAVPATRLSDGTLRWLCLLAILVAPSPPGVIVLEEPELGLHPDMINTLADMLKKAATRHQLVVTTHSDILIDALSDVPEAVMVVEKGEEGTTIRRLDAEEMKPWLEDYRLGRLWMRGQIGGTRW